MINTINMKIQNKITWRFIPSNIFIAFANSKKDKIVKKKEYSLKKYVFFKNDILISSKLIPGKKYVTNRIEIIKDINLIFGVKFFKSSNNPTK